MIYRSYKDLCSEIELVEAGIRQYERNRKALQQRANIDGPGEVRGIDYSQPSVVESNVMDFGAYLKQLSQIDSHLVIHRERLKILKKERKLREEKLRDMGGLGYRVTYLKRIKGKSLQEIADQLGYSVGYIQNISSRCEKDVR